VEHGNGTGKEDLAAPDAADSTPAADPNPPAAAERDITMNTLGWVLLALVVVAVVVLALWFARQRRSTNLRERFGPEYDRTVDRVGDRREAESRLSEVAGRRDSLDLRDLDADEVQRYRAQWDLVQARFVDEPGAALDDADNLLTTVMRDRGYPVDDFEERAALVSADHPHVVEHYRAAHAAHGRSGDDGVGTEDLRQAFVHYRDLFAELVGPTDAHGRTGTVDEHHEVAGSRTTVTDSDPIDSDERLRAAHGQEGTR
jgi:hypothetical protein